jgi:hypothetical protein
MCGVLFPERSVIYLLYPSAGTLMIDASFCSPSNNSCFMLYYPRFEAPNFLRFWTAHSQHSGGNDSFRSQVTHAWVELQKESFLFASHEELSQLLMRRVMTKGSREIEHSIITELDRPKRVLNWSVIKHETMPDQGRHWSRCCWWWWIISTESISHSALTALLL